LPLSYWLDALKRKLDSSHRPILAYYDGLTAFITFDVD